MMKRTWMHRVLAAFVVAAPLQLVLAGTKAPGPAGPEDDLGTLPATASAGPGNISGGDDDLGTLPSTKEDPAGPHLTFSGPVGAVTGLLETVTGPGQLGYRPGPEPGTVSAVLDGELSVTLRMDDPRLKRVRVAYASGALPALGELHAGAHTSGAFLLAPGSSLSVPVRSFAELPSLSELHRLELDLLDLGGVGHGLTLRTHGAFLLLDQTR